MVLHVPRDESLNGTESFLLALMDTFLLVSLLPATFNFYSPIAYMPMSTYQRQLDVNLMGNIHMT
jgi:hypothetical protein